MPSRRVGTTLIAALVATGLCLVAASAQAEKELSEDRIDALIEVLRERGVIDADDAEEIITRNASYEKKRSWLSRLTFHGDMRGRYEKFWNADRSNRERIRYRLRFGLDAEINDHIDFGMRLASGGLANSGNTSLGNISDFGVDAIFIDKAFLRLKPFGSGDIPIPTVTALSATFGKISNPFNTKGRGKDLLLWDDDINPEGVAAHIGFEPCDCLDVGFDAAYFVLTENSGGSDEDMFALQLDTLARPMDGVEVTNAISFYRWNDLTPDFFDRNANITNNSSYYGNVAATLSNDDDISVLDYRASVTISTIENWPVVLYGRYAKNFDARDNPTAGKEDTAWSAGLEVGDKKAFVNLGAGYFYVEANALPSHITDSDLFDGHTNTEGWAVYLTRQLFPSTDFVLTTLIGDAIERSLAPAGTLSRFDRVRLQGDLKVKF